jgi:SAM-dependent methyltransferase
MEQHTDAVAAHYHRDALYEAILDALARDGKDPARLTIDDLQMVDEVHSRGRETTAEVARLTAIGAGDRVLDVGCGLGGPARYLASRFGCRVTGIDLTAAFVETGNRLSELLDLSTRVSARVGNALAMPFADAAFDLAWTIQMQMSIADKARLYREIRRVLVAGGRLVFQDIVRGPVAGLLTPLPWAGDPAHSFLLPPEELRATIAAAGFEEVLWRDTTAAMQAWQAQQPAAPSAHAPRPALGIHLVLGPDAAAKRRNAQRNLAAGHIGFVQAVFRAQ